MMNQSENRRPISEDEAAIELRKLREFAKRAALYYNAEMKFERRRDLTHIVHASLHCVQFTFASATETFHHVHHYVNKCAREKDDTVPPLPEERNPVFFLYLICMLVSLVLAILWFFKKILPDRPLIPLIACATMAILMLVMGITEMKHADMYIDLSEFTDEEILEHPVFIHNFVMCILSIFVMTLYLVQAWILFDYWRWIRAQDLTTTSDTQSSDSSLDTDATESSAAVKIDHDSRQRDIELAPIPTFEDLSSPPAIVDNDMDDEPIVYCCFVDWYNYIAERAERKPRHEFQVIHVI